MSFSNYRKRLVEKFLHEFPEDEVDDDPALNFTTEDIAYLRNNTVNDWTNEIRPCAPKLLRTISVPKKGKVQVLKFESFQLRSAFPQNVCELSDGSIFLCSKFEQREDDDFIVFGHRFEKRDSLYMIPFDSVDVSISTVSTISNRQVVVNCGDIVRKCGLFPRGIRKASSIKPEWSTWKNWYCIGMIL
jgi:hypothetical protein